MGTEFYIAIGVLPVELLAYKFQWTALLCLYTWVECMMSSVISFAYFIQFSNLNISGTNADIYKRLTAVLFFHGILCDTPKN